MNDDIIIPHEDRIQSLKTITQVVYVLYALSYFTGITGIVGIIINYVKRDDAKGTWLESHFTWQIRTFWYGLLWCIIGWLTLVILIGFIVLFAGLCWMIYRIVKGWLYLNDGKPMPV
jgi:uncharacterized membrane protein